MMIMMMMMMMMMADDVHCGTIGGTLGRGNRSTRRKIASVLICPP
jgi:hypothetical protein